MKTAEEKLSNLRDKTITGTFMIGDGGLKLPPSWEFHAKRLEEMILAGEFASQPAVSEDAQPIDEFRIHIANELTREELINRLCETTQWYRDLREQYLARPDQPAVSEEAYVKCNTKDANIIGQEWDDNGYIIGSVRLKKVSLNVQGETKAIQKQDGTYHLSCQNCGTTSKPLQIIPLRDNHHVVGMIMSCDNCKDILYGQKFDREIKLPPQEK